MRLLNIQTLKLMDYISDDDVPPYAILSHTWDDEEVNFQQWENKESSDISHMKGYKKIKEFSEQAVIDGFDWVWVDTCCIDKKSSAELTEAINAMFRWYKNARVCYVYLSDALWCKDTATMVETLHNCRWFTRGWTLQELIATHNAKFYTTDWQKIGTKEQLCGVLSSITGIDEHILKGGNLEAISVARRMSWASHRKTTRTEDIAYCLFGLFDVNLPLIYGEGLKAFQRLQEAIMNTTNDQSLFAWGRVVEQPSDCIDTDQIFGSKPIRWKPLQQREPLLGLFAQSPKDFNTSSEISPVDHGYAHHINRQHPPSVVNRGVLIDLVIFKTIQSVSYWDCLAIAQPRAVQLAVLLCSLGDKGSRLVGLILHPWGDDYYSRTGELVLVDVFVSHVRFQSWTRTRHTMAQSPFQLRNGDILLRRWMSSFRQTGVSRPSTKSGPAWRQKWGDQVLRLNADATGDEEINIFMKLYAGRAVAITLMRVSKTMDPIGRLLMGVSLCQRAVKTSSAGTEYSGWVPMHGTSFRDPSDFHTMNIPSDTWELEVENLPRIYAKVDRKILAGGAGAIDVVDFFMYPDGQLARQAKIGLSSMALLDIA